MGLAGVTRSDLLGLPVWVALGATVGLIGSAVDSVLGAALQGMWHCPDCKQPSETPTHACGLAAGLVRGLPWLDNDMVNVFATLGGAALGYLLAGLGAFR